MIPITPVIPLAEIDTLTKTQRKSLEAAGILNLTDLFSFEGKLWDAVQLAKTTNLTIHDALGIRQHGRQYLINILKEIKEKKKVEPLELLWKVHWQLGILPEGDLREEALQEEKAAIVSHLETLESEKHDPIDRILIIFLHRTITAPKNQFNKETKLFVEIAERFQRTSLLAYQITKAQSELLSLTEKEEEPGQRIVKLRKLIPIWNAILKILEQRKETLGQKVLVARRAADNLKILDISEQHLKERVQETMGTKKLRQSQLTHLTAAMNAAVDLRDAFLVGPFAERSSRLWFELAQGKSSKNLSDDLLRSLRFTRTATFHYRALDDFNGIINTLKHLAHLIGEFPEDQPQELFESTQGIIKTIIGTIPLLDRPIDETLLLSLSQRIERVITILHKQMPTQSKPLFELQTSLQQVIITQFEKIGVKSESLQEMQRSLIHALLRLAEVSEKEKQADYLNTAAEHSKQLLGQTQPISTLSAENLEIISRVAGKLSSMTSDELKPPAREIIVKSYEINERRYYQTKDPQEKTQLALQLLLTKVSPNAGGIINLPSTTKELDKLEEYASSALIQSAKEKQKLTSLKAGSLLVGILLQRAHLTPEMEKQIKIREDAREFAEQTLSFMPLPSELNSEVYPFALLLLRSINDLVHRDQPTKDQKIHDLLTNCEQLAQTLATNAKNRQDISNQMMALSIAAATTAQLATITPNKEMQSQLLTRATTQIHKAIKTAAQSEQPQNVEAAISQFDRIIRARLITMPTLEEQKTLFEEWTRTFNEAAKTLEPNHPTTKKLNVYRLLNAEIPLIFIQHGQGKITLDTAKREITSALREIGKQGDKNQAELAKQLERRWAFQLGEDTILASGYRLEEAETSFTLADEHFRISLQVEPSLKNSNESYKKSKTFPYLQPSMRPQTQIWYDETPVLYSTYPEKQVFTWLTLKSTSEKQVSIGLWIASSHQQQLAFELKVLAIQALTQDTKGVTIQIPGATVQIDRPPTVAEHREDFGLLKYDLSFIPGHPIAFSLLISID